MAGKRILDAAKLLEATRGIAAQHIRIRREQLNVWTETSTLAQAVKQQTDRVTVTLQAAQALSTRLNEQGSVWQNEVTKRKDDLAQRINETVETNGSKASTSDQRAQDAPDALQRRVLQRQAERQIPSLSADDQPATTATSGSDVFDQRSDHVSYDLSSLPRTKLPKTASDVQGSEEHVPSEINQDVFYSRDDNVKERIDAGVFASPRIAQMLGQSKPSPKSPYAGKQRLPPKPLPEMLAAEERRQQAAAAPAPISSDKQSVQESTATTSTDIAQEPPAVSTDPIPTADVTTEELADSLAKETEPQAQYEMKESRVPSSRFGRIWQYGGLAASMAFGAANESLRRVTGSGGTGSLMLSEANMNRLVAKLSRMRGAALKLGQMMSFQDSMLPPAINNVLLRVQDSADYMPASQRNKVLAANLGDDWRDLFSAFEEKPFAAASIGQVHKATLASNSKDVAVKVQYPGVRNSIDSDLNNLSLLLTASRLLPRGLFLEKTIANARLELGWECDYEREAQACDRFRGLVSDEAAIFTVPEVYHEASGPDVLTAEFMHGTAVTKIPTLTQDERDWIGTQILRLCLRELMEWRFMQTDPNWTNFLYNRSSKKLELLDFGASREFPDKFVEPYVSLLIAASRKDRDQCRDLSIQLGYLTGQESAGMLKAHVDSILTLAEPFMGDAPAIYDFRDQTITDRVRANVGLMLRERLAPPPEETYSLHRKLSGAFLLCAKLQSRIKTRDMFRNAIEVWDDNTRKIATPA